MGTRSARGGSGGWVSWDYSKKAPCSSKIRIVTANGLQTLGRPRESRLGILSPQHEPQFSIETYAAIREFIDDADQCQTALGVPLWA